MYTDIFFARKIQFIVHRFGFILYYCIFALQNKYFNMKTHTLQDVKRRSDFLDRKWLLSKDQRPRINKLVKELKLRYCGVVEFQKISLGNVSKEILTGNGKYSLD